MQRKLKLGLALAAGLLYLHNPVYAQDLERMGFTRDVTYQGPNGTVTVQTVQSPLKYGFERLTTVTNPAGDSASREVQEYYDSASASWVKTVTLIGFDGDVSTTTSSTSFAEGYSNITTKTGPNGASLTREVAITVDEETHWIEKTVNWSGSAS